MGYFCFVYPHYPQPANTEQLKQWVRGCTERYGRGPARSRRLRTASRNHHRQADERHDLALCGTVCHLWYGADLQRFRFVHKPQQSCLLRLGSARDGGCGYIHPRQAQLRLYGPGWLRGVPVLRTAEHARKLLPATSKSEQRSHMVWHRNRSAVRRCAEPQ